jgi:hypothetical protein
VQAALWPLLVYIITFYKVIEGTDIKKCPENEGSIFLGNTDVFLQVHTPLLPGRSTLTE